MKSDILFQEITDRIRSQLEAGVRPWSKPWSADHDDRADALAYGLPINIEGRPYRGANVFWLHLIGKSQGYGSNVWLTFNQAKARGGAVKKGERGSPVFFWKFENKPDREDPTKMRKIVWAKGYTVFNIEQTEGVRLPKPKAPKTLAERHADAETLMEATNARIGYGGDKAFYAPSMDAIQLPVREAFKAPEFFYATAFHELGHWTGAKHRLDRTFGKRFGDEAYAAEELVAELTAAFVTGSLGLANPEREDHASYIANWLTILKGDPQAFITAAGKAQAAADFILAAGEALEDDEGADDVEIALAEAA